jgi:hypothetical protein
MLPNKPRGVPRVNGLAGLIPVVPTLQAVAFGQRAMKAIWAAKPPSPCHTGHSGRLSPRGRSTRRSPNANAAEIAKEASALSKLHIVTTPLGLPSNDFGVSLVDRRKRGRVGKRISGQHLSVQLRMLSNSTALNETWRLGRGPGAPRASDSASCRSIEVGCPLIQF